MEVWKVGGVRDEGLRDGGMEVWRVEVWKVGGMRNEGLRGGGMEG